MIERNDVFVYALKAAPAVLYERYKQFGQVGETRFVTYRAYVVL